ncbi:MAG: 50S ribosomal protein L22 [Verrucomicrobiae bacterium]|jgi:large subunit ribosomal protein L22|nr:50S ribosomal protein L22 [Verrucomicrobiae bacterium]
MEVKAIYKNFRMSAQKVREVVRQIQGLPAAEAEARLMFIPRKSARAVAKTLKSAIANAENNHDLRREDLTVREATAGKAMVMKRFMPRARGSASPILKRSSHIRIVLTDEKPVAKAAAAGSDKE